MAAGGPAPPGLLRHRSTLGSSSTSATWSTPAGGCHRTSRRPCRGAQPRHPRPLLWRRCSSAARTITRSTCRLPGRVHVLRRHLLKLVLESHVFRTRLPFDPLLLYGTFWYQYIPESNFRGNRTPLDNLGRFIYVLALLPTVLMVIGLVAACAPSDRWRAPERPTTGRPDGRRTGGAAHRAAFGCGMISVLGLTYDLWSWFQARYLFIAFPAVLLLYHAGSNGSKASADSPDGGAGLARGALLRGS